MAIDSDCFDLLGKLKLRCTDPNYPHPTPSRSLGLQRTRDRASSRPRPRGVDSFRSDVREAAAFDTRHDWNSTRATTFAQDRRDALALHQEFVIAGASKVAEPRGWLVVW